MGGWQARVLLMAGVAAIQVSATATTADAVAPQFTRVQPEMFAVGGALTSAWADFDGDGHVDLAVGFGRGEIRLYRNDRGVFTNVGPQLGLPTKGFEVRGLGWGDFDNDGDPDLFASTSALGGGMGRSGEVMASSMLFRNDAGGAFVDVAKEVGVAAVGPASRQVNWIDYDNDGDLDLFVTQRFSSNRLFRNDAGKFVDVSAKVGLMDPRRTVGACWFDFDQDGDLDVFIPNQQGDKDAFYRNDGAVFKDIAPELGMHQPNRTLDEGATMCGVGDYDNDGDFDIYASAYGANLLYRNEGNGKFSEVAAVEGIAGKRTTVGVDWGDFNNDGLLDVFVAGYVQESGQHRAVDRLLLNRGSGAQGGRFLDVLSADSNLHGADHGAHWADFDNDGDLDLSLAESYNPAGGHPVLRNELPEALRRKSLQIQVLDDKGHATRAGSEVRLFDASGKLLAARLVSPTQGYAAQSVLPVHFGLASSAPVTVEVTFMSTAGRKTKRVTNINPAKYFGKPALVIKQDSVPTLSDRVRATQPQHDGKLKLAGLKKPVEVVRDRWGIPHIYAGNRSEEHTSELQSPI